MKTDNKASYRVEAKEWFDKRNGNSYYAATVYKDGEPIHNTGFSYGYEDQYKHDTIEWLKANEGLSDAEARGEVGFLISRGHKKKELKGVIRLGELK